MDADVGKTAMLNRYFTTRFDKYYYTATHALINLGSHVRYYKTSIEKKTTLKPQVTSQKRLA